MRPKSLRRAPRAAAAAGVIVLAAGAFGGIANASSSTPPPRVRAARRQHRRARPPRLQALLVHPNVLIGQDVALVGVVTPRARRRAVIVQALQDSRWVAVARAFTGRRGIFVERFWPRRLGRLALRVRASGVTAARTLLRGGTATIYHEVIASWYGPGGTTACGESLGATTMGVANKTLPCGTMVTLRFRGRTVRVPVIDRGPFVPGRDYDLTYATRLALGAGDVTQLWASA
jgi:hypothetical protein